jgi:hypothetical protein
MSLAWLQHTGCPLEEHRGEAPGAHAVQTLPHCTWPAASQHGAHALNPLPAESQICAPARPSPHTQSCAAFGTQA